MQHKTIKLFIRFGLTVFIRMFAAATSFLLILVKPTSFLLIQETRSQWQFFHWLWQSWCWLYKTNIDILQNFSTAKFVPEAYLEPIRISTVKVFCNFLKEASPRMFYWVLNTHPVYAYIQVSLIEIIYIMNIFVLKKLFLTKREWNKAATSELNFYISY